VKGKIMKLPIFKLFLVLLVAVAVCTSALAGQDPIPPENAAVVNGKSITRKALEREVKLLKNRAASQGRQIPDVQIPLIQREILENMIKQVLLYQESRKQGIRVESKAVEEHFAGVKKRFPDEAGFKKAIEQMDITEEEIREQIQRGLAIQNLIDIEIISKIAVTESESRAYYKDHPEQFAEPAQVKASHILIKVEPGADDSQKAAARKKIEDIRKKIEDGEDFAKMAREYSEGPSSSRGGDLGFFKSGQMVKPFEDAAFALETGHVSEVVETRFGYHLIKVYDKKPEKTLAYTDAKDRLEQQLKRQKTKEKVDLFINRLKEDAKIEKRL